MLKITRLHEMIHQKILASELYKKHMQQSQNVKIFAQLTHYNYFRGFTTDVWGKGKKGGGGKGNKVSRLFRLLLFICKGGGISLLCAM